MDTLFTIQIITSFFVGGAAIALLTFLAERTSARLAGMIIIFPSTVALSFFFLGWTVSSDTVARVAPATFIPLGLAVLFPAVYAYAAEVSESFFKSKLTVIAASFLASIGIWFLLSLPVVLFKFSNIWIGLFGYSILAFFSHFLLHRRRYPKPTPLVYTISQKIGRAVFAGSIIALGVFLSKVLHPFWGGMLAMFPAALSSSLMTLHWYYPPESLFPAVQKVPIGSLVVLVYVCTVMFTFSKIGFVLGTVAAYVVSVGMIVLLTKVQAKLQLIHR